MNERTVWFIIFLLIAIALSLIVHIATAVEIITITEVGQRVYLGDTCDVRLVLGWGDQLSFAWFKDNIYGDTPDQIYKATDFQNKYYLDPLTFKIGKYYQWSGKYEESSYPLAFEIIPGKRPVPIPTASGKATPVPTPTPKPEDAVPKSTHIILARGDNASFWFGASAIGTDQKGYIWLFPQKTNTPSVMGVQMDQPIEGLAYRYNFTPQITDNLIEGWYAGFLQFTGSNGYQDVFYDYQTNSLDTPYDDTIIPDVSLDGFIPVRYQQEFVKLSNISTYCDDILVPITMEVHPPSIFLTDYFEDEDVIIVGGTTPLSEGTNLSFMIDPERWVFADEKAKHTWYAEATGPIGELRKFRAEMKLKWDETAIGWHTVEASVDKFKFHADNSVQFRVQDIYVVPTPTPEKIRVVMEEYGWHQLDPANSSSMTLEQKMKESLKATNETTTIPIPTPTANITTVQTTMTTAPTPTPISTPKPAPTIAVPVSTMTILIGVGLGLWRIRKWN